MTSFKFYNNFELNKVAELKSDSKKSLNKKVHKASSIAFKIVEEKRNFDKFA